MNDIQAGVFTQSQSSRYIYRYTLARRYAGAPVYYLARRYAGVRVTSLSVSTYSLFHIL